MGALGQKFVMRLCCGVLLWGYLRQKKLWTKEHSLHNQPLTVLLDLDISISTLCMCYLSLKNSISPRKVVTASKTIVESQASGVAGGSGPTTKGSLSGFGPVNVKISVIIYFKCLPLQSPNRLVTPKKICELVFLGMQTCMMIQQVGSNHRETGCHWRHRVAKRRCQDSCKCTWGTWEHQGHQSETSPGSVQTHGQPQWRGCSLQHKTNSKTEKDFHAKDSFIWSEEIL